MIFSRTPSPTVTELYLELAHMLLMTTLPGEQDRCTAGQGLAKVERLVVGLGQSKMCSSVPGTFNVITSRKLDYPSTEVTAMMQLGRNQASEEQE